VADVGAAIRAGVLGRCPKCGKGRLYASYLRLADKCGACGADFSMADSGDGAIVFVILVVGALAVPFVLVLQLAFGLPLWFVALSGLVFVAGLSLVLLPVFKGVLFTLQWVHGAREGRLQDD
jgi:uncharacterized protein (DUF983 family)